jgi:hypothetical protein
MELYNDNESLEEGSTANLRNFVFQIYRWALIKIILVYT